MTDATANDAVDAGVRTADASVSWQVAYTGVQATTVTAPAPTAGASRQTFVVNYDSAATAGTPGVSRVTASGLSAPNGYTKKVSFDTSYRTVSAWDDNGQRSDVTYDGVSDRVSFTDTNVGTAQAMRSSTVYDTSVVFNGLSRPVTSYGPAPVGYFTANIKNIIDIGEYFSFMIMTILGAGLIFELPMITFVLSSIGLVTAAMMRKYRRHAIIAILFIAAVITPSPDPINQLIFACPLYILYEISIVIARVTRKQAPKEKTA